MVGEKNYSTIWLFIRNKKDRLTSSKSVVQWQYE